MNATRWHTLSGFVQWLGKTGYCKIDFVEEKNQWYVEYVDNSPETLARKAEKEKLAKSRKDDAEREQFAIAAMVERGKARAEKKGITDDAMATELKREEGDAPIKVSLKKSIQKLESRPSLANSNPFKQIKATKPDKPKTQRKLTAIEEIKMMEEAQKKRLEEHHKADLKRMGIEPKPEVPKKKTKQPVKWIHKKIVGKIL